jgi:FkbM family methyltransferase
MRFPLRYRVRRFLAPNKYLPCYVQSASGAWHYLKNDRIDDWVLQETLGVLEDVYFPPLSTAILEELNGNGLILDVGAFNGFWAAEMLARYPAARAVLIEPNLEKGRCIARTLQASHVNSRARLVPAALTETDGHGWLMRPDWASWGRYVQMDKAKQDDATEISTVTLATALGGERPVIVKSNSEGAEFELIRQLFALGLRPKLMILMVHPEHGDAKALWNDLSAKGYEITIVRDDATHPAWHARLVN